MALVVLPVVVQAVHPPGEMMTHQCWIVDHGLGATKTARVHKTLGGMLKIGASCNQLRIRSAVWDDGIWPHGWCSIWTHQAQDNSTTMWWHGKDDGGKNTKWEDGTGDQQVMRQQPRRINGGGWEE